MYLISLFVLIFYLSMGPIQHKAFAAIDNAPCGVQNTGDSDYFIVGGHEAKYLQFPWIALVSLWTGTSWWAYCGASLINSKFALSAAHCFYGDDKKRIEDVKKYQITLGMRKTSIKERYRQDQCLKSITLHEDHDFDVDKNDIALLELCEPISFATTKIRPICLPSKSDDINLYEDGAIVAGWGWTSGNAWKQPDELLTVNLKLGNNTECIKQLIAIHKNSYLYNSTVCTTNKDTEKDTCRGDSGGPLMVTNKKSGLIFVRGICSFGSSTCNGYGVFTKTSFFLDWINENMNNLTNKRTKPKSVLKKRTKGKNSTRRRRVKKRKTSNKRVKAKHM